MEIFKGNTNVFKIELKNRKSVHKIDLETLQNLANCENNVEQEWKQIKKYF